MECQPHGRAAQGVAKRQLQLHGAGTSVALHPRVKDRFDTLSIMLGLMILVALIAG